MPSILRNRTRNLKGTVGGTRQTRSFTYLGGNLVGSTSPITTSSGPYLAGNEVMIDFLSLGTTFDDHYLDLDRRLIVRQGLVNGYAIEPNYTPSNGTQYQVICSNWSSSIVGSIWNSGIPTIPSVNYTTLVNKALAGVNPRRPVVDVPLFIFELREFPRMLMEMGQILAKYRSLADALQNASSSDLGVAGLTFSFGWAPFFNDLRQLDSLARAYYRQLKLFTEAKKGGNWRQSLGKTDNPAYKKRSITLVSVGTKNLVVEVNDRLIERFWATMRFEPKDPVRTSLFDLLLNKPPPPGSLWKLDPNGLLGLGKGFSAATLWNAYPWTWLIDYLTNISLFLEAGVVLPFQVRDLNVMAHQLLLETSTVTQNPTSLTYTPHEFRIERKGRRVYKYPYPSLTVSFDLSPRRFFNLGSLITAKKRRLLG